MPNLSEAEKIIYKERLIQQFALIKWNGALQEAEPYLKLKEEMLVWLGVVHEYVLKHRQDHKGFTLLAKFNAKSGETETASRFHTQAVRLAITNRAPLTEQSEAALTAAEHFANIGQRNMASKLYDFALKSNRQHQPTISAVVDFYMDARLGNKPAKAQKILQASPKASISGEHLQSTLRESPKTKPPAEIYDPLAWPYSY